MLIFRAQSNHVLVRVVTCTPSILVISSSKNCPTWPITPLRRAIAIVSGREMWMLGEYEPGRKPGNSQIKKAVSWEAAENWVTRVRGRARSFTSAECSAGNLIPRLGTCRERCLSRRRLTPAFTAS